MARQVGRSGRVLSFEPTPDTRQALERIVSCNRLDSIVVIRPEAVAGTVGYESLHAVPTPTCNANSLVAQPGATETIRVRTVSIDSVVGDQEPISCLKIDAEGAEVEVLEGARATVMRCRPAIALDVHPRGLSLAGHSLSRLWLLLAELGYRAIDDVNPGASDEGPPPGGDGLFSVHLVAT
jgi:FkbM family methyltransferase